MRGGVELYASGLSSSTVDVHHSSCRSAGLLLGDALVAAALQRRAAVGAKAVDCVGRCRLMSAQAARHALAGTQQRTAVDGEHALLDALLNRAAAAAERLRAASRHTVSRCRTLELAARTARLARHTSGPMDSVRQSPPGFCSPMPPGTTAWPPATPPGTTAWPPSGCTPGCTTTTVVCCSMRRVSGVRGCVLAAPSALTRCAAARTRTRLQLAAPVHHARREQRHGKRKHCAGKRKHGARPRRIAAAPTRAAREGACAVWEC